MSPLDALDVEQMGGITRAARLVGQEALRVEAEQLSVLYGIPVYPARRRGEDGLTVEVDGVTVSGPAAEVRAWLAEHATPVHRLGAVRRSGSRCSPSRAGRCLCGWRSGPMETREAVWQAYAAHLTLAPAGEASPVTSPAGQELT